MDVRKMSQRGKRASGNWPSASILDLSTWLRFRAHMMKLGVTAPVIILLRNIWTFASMKAL